MHAISRKRLRRSLVAAPISAAWLAACNSASSERVIVPTSDPRVGCSVSEGEGASKDAEAAIAHAKAAWAAIHDKTHDETSAPDYLVRFEPYSATLKDGVWHVQGTITPDFHGYAPVMSVCRNDEAQRQGRSRFLRVVASNNRWRGP
jgi:hypothetical protein